VEGDGEHILPLVCVGRKIREGCLHAAAGSGGKKAWSGTVFFPTLNILISTVIPRKKERVR
jgi:hypothetical protein